MKNKMLKTVKAQEIKNFWFEDMLTSNYSLYTKISRKLNQWFKQSDEFDQLVKTRFFLEFHSGINGEYEDWKSDENCITSYIILFDQFSRFMFRNDYYSCRYDFTALEAALDGLETGIYKNLHLLEKLFFISPLGHSEDIHHQKLSLEFLNDLKSECQDHYIEKVLLNFRQYSESNHDIIEKFGRFPSRNSILDRKSTREEIEFLKERSQSNYL